MQDPSLPDDEALVRRLTESRALKDAPEAVTQRAIALWDKHDRPRAVVPAPRRLSAVLIPQSADPSLGFAGLRADVPDQRHLVFSLEGRDVDVRIRRSSAAPGDGWVVSGQLLGPDEAGRTSLRCGAFEAEAPWSPLCEFHFEPVPEGECVVSLVTDDWEAVLPAFELRTAA